MKRFAALFSALLLLFILWQLVCSVGQVPKYILPSPADVVRAFGQDWRLMLSHARVTLLETFIGLFFGILIGSLCGYYGGIADLVLMRICDTITAFPAILLALVIISVVGGGSGNIVIALGILFIPSFARVVRTQFAVCRSQNYISSAKLMGVSGLRILFFHILPNTFSVLLPSVTIGFNNAVLAEASMSFLGIGIQPPQASLGSMLKDSQTYLKSAPWYALGTGLAVVLLVLAFSLLSEGIQQGSRRQ